MHLFSYLVLIIGELYAVLDLEPLRVLDKEPIGVEPREEDVLDDVADAFLLEAKRLGAHDRRVDQIETKRIGTVRIQNVGRIRIVLEALAHLLAVTVSQKMDEMRATR